MNPDPSKPYKFIITLYDDDGLFFTSLEAAKKAADEWAAEIADRWGCEIADVQVDEYDGD